MKRPTIPPVAASQPWISRHALGWLLAAQLLVITPHMQRLPIWVIAAWLLCVIWRIQVYRGFWSFPGRLVKIGLVLGCLAGIRASYGTPVGLEPTVALLISCFSFKLIESSSRRDAYLLIFLGYFVALTEFLFGQGLGTVLFMTLPVLLLTAALIALHQQQPLRFGWQPIRSAAIMIAQALPLMLLLFLVFPRIGPLWQVPLPGGGAKTGMSDELSPGDIAQLSQSSELAFRAAFTGAMPSTRDLYWRGLVLDEFDGRTWRASSFSEFPRTDEKPLAGASFDYEVFLEPTYRRWLFALQVPASIDPKTQLSIDYRLLARDIVAEKFAYRARAYPQAMFDVELDPRLRKFELTLPSQGNPRTRAWASQLRERFDDDAQLIEFLLTHFRQQNYFYTLKPPLLGEHSIDEFIFDTRKGFCEHYASSFVYLLRAANIPARVVVGYQGGEINPLTGTVLVHQFDAHAWAEVWLPQRGWVRFDPTAAVAPQRIENGLERAVGAGEFLSDSPLSANRYRAVNLLNWARYRLDAMNYAWTRWVVNYRDDTQTLVLQTLLGKIDPLRMVLLLVGGGAVMMVIAALGIWGKRLWRTPLLPEQRDYQKFCAKLARAGYPKPIGMGVRDYCHWILQQQPQWEHMQEITACYEALSYRKLSESQRRQLRKKLRRIIRRPL